jgi:hypothetical protein
MEDDRGFSAMPNHAQLPRKRGTPIYPAKNVPIQNSLILSSISGSASIRAGELLSSWEERASKFWAAGPPR